MIRRIGKRYRGEEGQTQVEAAIGLVMFLMFLFGIVDLGRALYTYHFVAFAADAGSRYAIVHGASSGSAASATDISNYVKTRATQGLNPNAMTVTTTWSPDNQPGSTATVTVNYAFAFNLPFLPSKTVTMSKKSAMIISQ